ncbi:hypothetical protein SYNPS1DRAFT_20636 [Syncephalis pseudoplumigaleata]|uniref:G-protein coupled receptors family 1 profile domain-containing protein n=1 Tax=Syncephalis pseudoplumigaleata TaxID=1712513 RepID=A0A4P9Z719_9FUNG|nr:hypothetical protein SYNPS1DRAFT_20636 [Syncephalis pseudoplumigaleata]|eukprot:RKP27982.1 hypothetical protein SYNPS1DRAFT_20636 [Syncephalis pseudoplumigaleata]
MRLSDHPSHEAVCEPYVNIYDCIGGTPAFYTSLVSILASSITIVYGIWIYTYRRRHGICSLVFRRVDYYWLPVPMESYLVSCMVTAALRLTIYSMIIADWPANWVFRTSANGFIWFASFCTVILLTTGIIGHIPPIFSRRRSYHDYDAITPTTSMHTGAAAAAVAETAPDGQRAMDMPQTHSRIVQAFCYVMSSMMLVMCAISGYYYNGFYRIIQAYAQRSQTSSTTKKEEIAAVWRFRRVFMVLLAFVGVAFFSLVIYGVFIMHSREFSTTTAIWLANALFLSQYGLAYPFMEGVVLHTIHKSSEGAEPAHRQPHQHPASVEDHAA